MQKKFLSVFFLLVFVFLFSACGVRGDKHFVFFETSGGNEISSQRVKNGKRVKKPKDPVRTDYVFCYWYKSDEERPYNFEDSVLENFILFAKWEKSGNFSVNFYAQNSDYFLKEKYYSTA